MVFRRSTIILLLLPFLLAGCFRQASDSFDGVDDTNADPQAVQETLPPIDNTEPPTLAIGGDDDDDNGEDDQATATTAPQTGTSDDDTDTEDMAPDDDEDLPTLSRPVTATPLAPATSTSEATATTALGQTTNNDDDDTETGPSATPTFITPGAPTRQPDAATPTPGANTATPSGLVTPTDFLNPDNVSSECLYIVQPGDNLFRIAVNNGTTLDALRAANPQIQGDVIQPGDQLILPVAGCEGADVSEAEAPDEPETGPTTVPGQTIHTVSAGETLSIIARRYGTTITEIVQANNLTNPDRLNIGQQLIIPVGDGG